MEAEEGSLLESEGPLDLLAERKVEGSSNAMDKRNSATTRNVHHFGLTVKSC